jgi:flagellar basal-body rod protein FlgB
MAISFDNALGIHEQAMQFRVKRSEVLANNLVNADTPNYKARDIEFSSVLEGELNSGARLQSTNSQHIAPSSLSFEPQLMYRNPLQPSLDGNTVDEQVEMTRFAKNSIEFQASFQFLSNKFKGLSSAIKGES